MFRFLELMAAYETITAVIRELEYHQSFVIKGDGAIVPDDPHFVYLLAVIIPILVFLLRSVIVLKKMLEHETSKTEEHYGARLSHWYGDSKVLTIDAGGLRALIRYYS